MEWQAMTKQDCGEAGCAEGRCGTTSCLPKATSKTPGMAVQCVASEVVAALLADEADGGYDLTAGLFGPAFSGLVRKWAALEYASCPKCQSTRAGFHFTDCPEFTRSLNAID
jgi:hypothetical protein